MFKIIINTRAKKDLKNIKKTPYFDTIIERIQELSENPFRGDVKKMESYTLCDYRKRVGNYRILFDINVNKKFVYIHRVLHRKDAYK